MKKVCAWCQGALSDIPPADDGAAEGLTHGICPPCAYRLFGVTTASQELRDFLDTISVPVMALDSSGTPLAVNSGARELLDLPDVMLEGIRPGEVFLCQYATLPGGCGNTVHCSGCAIRRAITETAATGVRRDKAPAFLHQGDRNVSLLISTEKVGDVVLLTVEPV